MSPIRTRLPYADASEAGDLPPLGAVTSVRSKSKSSFAVRRGMIRQRYALKLCRWEIRDEGSGAARVRRSREAEI